jgi:DNA mismatch repair ATPase MutS
MMNKESLKARYLGRVENYSLLAAAEERLLVILSFSRLIVFAGGIVLLWVVFLKSISAALVLLPILTALFLILLRLYSSHSAKKVFLQNLMRINQDEATALSGDISAFESGESYADIDHDFSNDIDLFGYKSLFQYLNRTITGYGRDILASWLSEPYLLASDLKRRQAAVRELAKKEQWRHDFMATGMNKTLEKSYITDLEAWMNEETYIKSSALNRLMIWILPALTILSFILVVAGLLNYAVFILLFLFNLFIIAAGIKRTNAIHRALTGKHNYISSLSDLLKLFENEIFDSEILADVKQNISGDKISAAVSVKKLGKLIEAFDARLNIVVVFLLNGFLLWDYQSVYRLEKWKSEYRNCFPVWLEMLGRMDALISLANYSYNNPSFVYPHISDREVLLTIRKGGHPLIDENIRVCNDFTLARPGMVCIISGANMAGKSTFLRTVAVNYVLAMAGAPVCAEEMHFTPLKLFTSMRTTDSLSGNESYFYAELRRLKILKAEVKKREPVLFILDEILKGTNSADKSLGSKMFLKRMVELGGTGMIATHDTSLGEMENEYPGVVINKCFEIEIDGDKIIFDYRLQDGITHKMNAAFLMKQMGILD